MYIFKRSHEKDWYITYFTLNVARNSDKTIKNGMKHMFNLTVYYHYMYGIDKNQTSKNRKVQNDLFATNGAYICTNDDDIMDIDWETRVLWND